MRTCRRLAVVALTLAVESLLCFAARWVWAEFVAVSSARPVFDIVFDMISGVAVILFLAYMAFFQPFTAFLMFRNIRDWGTIFVPKRL